MRHFKIILVFGTRPEAIKMAPLFLQLQKHGEFEPVIVITAQHRDMLDQVMDIFEMTPCHDLDLMKPDQPITHVVSQGIEKLFTIISSEKPDGVLVHGDTTTTFVASLASFYARVPVGHIEAGLRTGNIYSPFPEEMNRRLTSRVAAWHFAPTDGARSNLLREGIADHSIAVTGNTVIDALRIAIEKPFEFNHPKLRELIEENRKIILVTAHRRENFGAPLNNLFSDLLDFVAENEDFHIVYPVHPNPNVLKPATEKLVHPRILLVQPLDYLPFVNLMNHCFAIVTDSGGLQEEAPGLGKPVIVFRDTTERPEAIEAGTAILAGTERGNVLGHLKRLVLEPEFFKTMAQATNPFGDGNASIRIVDFLRSRLLETDQ
ncbi:MAG: UDP-N-acetylglucosamine 2-epimerase (non-hydrolyzing) [Candidatus Wallbacteria bacterium HGW-Wallbacteria-1]|jgi:UDP-N-acetylglucosamine 2-epimerase (non-hydrolysing)|uniref:UDP-N-acetylglucosamine 2-epimerase (non-hydrolyzing) n=1 Tax=Candidatus Wallbacteria bacterium HGW-Wallbacteria-1 TaxID=2013854 RepID=A0A2N1PUI5_9BACT|nr:MAG: UDP-N-acetylglucosamine 2-epimerase (non-hydrolyzing) [Candidatus Wallbacteria bacterium HGW-Wallbacteria-1]